MGDTGLKRLFVCVLALCIILSGCSLLQSQQESTTQPTQNTTSPMEKTMSDADMLLLLQPLVERNIQCVQDIFYCRTLEVDTEKSVSDVPGAYAVQSEKFTTYEMLDTFVRSTYVQSVADDMLLNRPEGEEESLYFEKDGILYENTNLRYPHEQAVDWEDYPITIHEKSAVTCSFSVTVRVMQEGVNTQETKEIAMQAVLTGENWLLERLYIGDE